MLHTLQREWSRYGITECGSITFRNNIENTGQSCLEFIPVSAAPSMVDPMHVVNSSPKIKQMFSGYISDPYQRTEVLTHHGFFRTDDVVELRPASNNDSEPRRDIIDRKKNFFKLAEG